jgi:hypothetical protein
MALTVEFEDDEVDTLEIVLKGYRSAAYDHNDPDEAEDRAQLIERLTTMLGKIGRDPESEGF